MVAARLSTGLVVAWMVGLAVGAVAQAQPPDGAPAAGVTSEQLQTPAAAETPTRRRTRRSTPTSTVTDTPTASASSTATHSETPTAPRPTATVSRPPTATVTQLPPAPTATATARAVGWAGEAGRVLPLALGAALALAGVWTGARIAGAGAARRRARRTLATAMLLELRRIDAVLRRVVALDNPTSFPSLEHPIMEAALRDLTLFQTNTAARIAQFHSALRGIQHEVGDYRDNPLRWAGRLAELNQLIKTRAAAACRAVPELLKALEKEGGAPPPHLAESQPSAAATPSGLPPPPFGAGDADDWTL